LKEVQGGFAAGADFDAITHTLQITLQQVENRWFVIYN
jgi:hypothetical protein